MKNGMKETEKLIKNSAFRIKDNIKELLPSTNGIINNDLIQTAVLGSLHRTAKQLEPFVKIKYKYPEYNHTEVEFETDLVVMKTEDYNKLLNKIKELENGNT